MYATGARPIGAPGCPEFAFCTASIARVRIVLMQSVSRGVNWAMSASRMVVVGVSDDDMNLGIRRNLRLVGATAITSKRLRNVTSDASTQNEPCEKTLENVGKNLDWRG